MSQFLLGFEVGTGLPVHMTCHHTAVTGMTQLSGKTTGLEAMVERSKVKAIAFLTKRGESGFLRQKYIQPYFKEQKKGNLIDWQYVEAILEATMGERMKFERYWIIKVCKGAKSLQQVYENIKREQGDAKRALDESIYTNLAAYFEIILPEIGKYKFANTLKLSRGINVLNLVGMKDEMQHLVIESVLSYVLRKEKNTVVIIPEAHKFIPQGKKTPVKGTALRLIREGAAIGNYMWIDTQETTSVDKAILKQCSNWIMGYQQEKNEVQNVRENIGKRNIKEEDIMSLQLGHFIASLQQKIYHVYILPAGIDEALGIAVAKGEKSVTEVRNILRNAPKVQAVMPEENPEAEQDMRQIFTEPSSSSDETPSANVIETERTLRRRIKEVEEEYGEYKTNSENQEQAYRDSIDGLTEQLKTITRERDSLDNRCAIIEEEHEKLVITHEAMLQSLELVLEPIIKRLIPEASVKVDEKVLKRLIDKKIDSLPAKQRRKIEVEGETGIPWVDMWLPKLQKPVERKIVVLLAGRIGVPLTKTQIALATGYAVKGGTFLGALGTLKNKYKLIKQEGDTYSIVEAPA